MDDFKKLNGRPILKEGRRCKKIDVRFTREEYDEVVALSIALGISNTELIRIRVLTDAGKVVINSRELLKHLDNIGAEMGRSGNNINQLAKHANILKLQGALSPLVAIHFNDLLENYIKMQQALQVSLRNIIRSMGK